MRVCHATTYWPNRFGHTHYTDALISGMQTHLSERHFVAGEGATEAAQSDTVRCEPCFDRRTDYVDPLYRKLREFDADVVIFQYSDDLFGHDDRLVRLLRLLREARVATIVNSHSIYPERRRRAYHPGRCAAALDRALAQQASAMMVHCDRMRQDLIRRGVAAEKIAVIPHGSRAMEQREMQESRRVLGLPPEGKVVLFFGFIWLGKGLDFLLEVFRHVARRVPDAYLYVGGYTRLKVFYTELYMRYLRVRRQLLGIADRCVEWGDYVPDAMVSTIYSAADVVAMPYRQDYSSVSGVVHQTSGIGKLMLCSRIAKFDEVEHQISRHLVAGNDDLHGWVEGLVRLLTDEAFAAAMRERIVQFARETSWENTGRLHLQLCQGVLAGQSAAAALGQL